ncbi:hypothetical protein BT63DRAFT_408570 [Microthyrium microscopicum]|uniref:Peptide hydrolase n=1 Tax=Microthyrium microscopicum TaxID=703497 RepID=A0A6A6UQ05_9PEZI|nr:hypothetical protein BT63DRAFT_408570 [Microthyrium microscopicum]
MMRTQSSTTCGSHRALSQFCSFILFGFLATTTVCEPDYPSLDWYHPQVDLLAQLQSRLTGSPNHTTFVNHLESQLQSLGLQVNSDVFQFAYNQAPQSPPQIQLNGQTIPASFYIPYSGNTDAVGVTGTLVNVINPALSSPDWSRANGSIAVLNITNPGTDGAKNLAVWPGSPAWGTLPGVPASAANIYVHNLTDAARLGVKGVIYAWQNLTLANAYGQYGPFKINYQGIPAVQVAGSVSQQIVAAANQGSTVTLTSTGQLFPNGTTRTLWTIVEGTERKNESVIISTHTDGSNVVEENGHLALLAKARELKASPPKRTTILVFLTGHLHTSGFTDKGRVMARWLSDHQDLWNGTNGNGYKALFGSCVEHLGAVQWKEDVANDLYYPTGRLDPEVIYAATEELASLFQSNWRGATPDTIRATNPLKTTAEQGGEGLPFLWSQIPEISLVTAPSWLLKIWPEDFNQTQLMDIPAAKRQVDSFLRIWEAVDILPQSGFGKLNYTRNL